MSIFSIILVTAALMEAREQSKAKRIYKLHNLVKELKTIEEWITNLPVLEAPSYNYTQCACICMYVHMPACVYIYIHEFTLSHNVQAYYT